MRAEQAAYRHNNQTKTKHGMPLASHFATWPFRIIRQTWREYRNGRNMRKRITQGQDPETDDNHSEKAEDETNEQRGRRGRPVSATDGSSPDKHQHGNPPSRSAQRPPRRGLALADRASRPSGLFREPARDLGSRSKISIWAALGEERQAGPTDPGYCATGSMAFPTPGVERRDDDFDGSGIKGRDDELMDCLRW
ncbi:hypothetical protein F4782DRAFT_535072 [Xylaria castorea]|nr:hypothetical protein F4782DRAFT_535072 [Xylaria castorea]